MKYISCIYTSNFQPPFYICYINCLLNTFLPSASSLLQACLLPVTPLLPLPVYCLLLLQHSTGGRPFLLLTLGGHTIPPPPAACRTPLPTPHCLSLPFCVTEENCQAEYIREEGNAAPVGCYLYCGCTPHRAQTRATGARALAGIACWRARRCRGAERGGRKTFINITARTRWRAPSATWLAALLPAQAAAACRCLSADRRRLCIWRCAVLIFVAGSVLHIGGLAAAAARHGVAPGGICRRLQRHGAPLF